MKNAFRIGYRRYQTEEEYAGLENFLKQYMDCVDEVAFLTEYSHHGYFPLEDYRKLSLILEDRILRLKRTGIPSVGLNVVSTVGHIDEAWDVNTAPPFQTMVGHDGIQSRSCLCPNAPEFEAYISEKYRLLASANPDFIWVDDDVRMYSHKPVSYGCFCPVCIDIFNRKYKTHYDRESLVALLNMPGSENVRKQWVEQNHDTITRLLQWIEKAVHHVNPNIKLGLMTCSINLYSGGKMDGWLQTLKADRARPGGGFYEDSAPIKLIYKIMECQRQVEQYPKEIMDIQYEVENFPYQRLLKSLHSLMLECTAGLMNGMNGIAYNAMLFENYDELLDQVRKFKNYWTAIDRIGTDYVNVGLYPALPEQAYIRRSVRAGEWFSEKDIYKTSLVNRLCEVGIPITMNENHACGILLSGKMADGFSDNELIEILRGGVLLDGEALEILWKRGLGEYCGVKIKEIYDNGVYETFTDHPLNGIKAAGKRRDIFVTFWGEDCNSYTLEPLNDRVEILNYLFDVKGKKLGPVFSICENALGGRVAVSGFMPWGFLYSDEKRRQINQVCDWLSSYTMPLEIDKCLKVVPFVRKSQQTGNILFMLTNCFLDATGEFDVTLRVPGNAVVYLLNREGDKKIVPEGLLDRHEKEIVLKIMNIGAWEHVIYGTENSTNTFT